MCETTDLIKKLAHEGKSKNNIAKTLGISMRSLRAILELIGPVTFYKEPTYTVRGFHGTIPQIIAHFGLRVSKRIVLSRMADYKDLEECFFSDKYGKVEEVRGFKGSTIEIINHFQLPLTADRVYKRRKAGKTLEEAFFEPINASQSRVRTRATSSASQLSL